MAFDKIILNREKNVYLRIFPLPCGGEFRFTKTRPAVLILPGGGYFTCSEREAEPIAHAYNAKGFHAFILNYSVGIHFDWPNPLDDYETAMAWIDAHAVEYGVDVRKIAVVGFSAGGHLAAAASCLAKRRPAAAILGYPALMKSTVIALSEKLPDLTKEVNRETCPSFLFTSRNDQTVSVDNTIGYAKALSEQMIDFEVHIYAYGTHGFSLGTFEMLGQEMNENTPRVRDWIEDSVEWMNEHFAGKMVSCRTSANALDRDAATLSTLNSIGHLMDHPEAASIIEAFLPGFALSPQTKNIKEFSLHKILLFGDLKDKIPQIDQQLSKIAN